MKQCLIFTPVALDERAESQLEFRDVAFRAVERDALDECARRRRREEHPE